MELPAQIRFHHARLRPSFLKLPNVEEIAMADSDSEMNRRMTQLRQNNHFASGTEIPRQIDPFALFVTQIVQ